ncbi:STAS domain-containing protein [Planomonospora sp. ID67723]|uniref:STAS domain-containing protein n=1 Tax=Planomonospora sp. ID67723 TaxID=2738134 RepID=UPI0018C380AB|nr:STAS domain-containing protein [Planomonospora sp. ID67723]MBG0832726.1 STAS domain-containing protein [Planomonospora sp. ID67723]
MTAIDTAPLGGAGASAPTCVHLSGDIDIFTTAQLRRKLLNTLNYSTGLLTLDLSRVTFCGAGGLGVLLGVQGRARALGITLALTGVPPFMTRLLRVSGLDHRFPIVA